MFPAPVPVPAVSYVLGAPAGSAYKNGTTVYYNPQGDNANAFSVTATASDGESAIQKITLNTDADVPGIDDATFQKIAKEAKEGCPVSKALAAVPSIVLNAKLKK